MQLEGFNEASAILRSGVYALCAKGRVIYVGKSRSMIGRIDAHHKAWRQKRAKGEAWITEALGIPGLLFDEIHIRPCPVHDLDRLEREMIDRYRPHYNVNLVPKGTIRAPISIVIAGRQMTLNASPAPLAQGITRRV